MAAATTYYIHIYKITPSGGALVKTQAFTTASMPADARMQAYSGGFSGISSFLSLPVFSQAVEFKAGESIILPLRFIQATGSATNLLLNVNPPGKEDQKIVSTPTSPQIGAFVEVANIAGYSTEYSMNYASTDIRDYLLYWKTPRAGEVELRSGGLKLIMFTIAMLTE